ncbi:MAG TPA: prephenate dehydratase [Stenomitos sp.]
MTRSVAFQGEPGAYSEAALLAHFGPTARPLPCPSFEQVFSRVSTGEADAGILPIENSLAGSILENYDLLLEHDLPIIGEVRLNVRHSLMAAPGTPLAAIRWCYSHPQALAQCAPWLKAHGIEPRVAHDTAGAARLLAERPEPNAGAIASAHAAGLYGLQVLADGIQSRPDNTTRFFVVARTRPDALSSEKASLVFATANRPGALHACLGAFADAGLNLTKLESRPTRATPWEYHFYLDFEGDAGSPPGQRALEALQAHARFVRLLGAYPRARDGALLP